MIKVAALSIGALLAISGSAMAADLYVPPAAPVFAAPAASSWDGPYIGATVGYGWSHLTLSSPGSGEGDGSGFLVGGQIGYNFHVSDNIVLGVQGNIDWNNESGAAGDLSDVHGNWDGAAVARLGLDAGQFLPYIEAGVAFANVTGTVDTGGGALDGTYSGTHTGWTVGAGVEFMLADNLSANVEYRYSDYGSQNYTSADIPVSITDNQIRLGLNWHF